jgi:hypothetical protein
LPDIKDLDERQAVDFGKLEVTSTDDRPGVVGTDCSGITNDIRPNAVCFDIWPGGKTLDSHTDWPSAAGTCMKDDSSWLLADIDLSLTLLPFLRFGSDLLRAF